MEAAKVIVDEAITKKFQAPTVCGLHEGEAREALDA